MTTKTMVTILIIFCFSSTSLNAQYTMTETEDNPFFIGSSLFVLANLIPDENAPDFGQINFGYRLNPKNVISVELKTWKYAWPLGIHPGDAWEAPEEKFPGYIREFGVAIAYQHYWWKGLYSAVHVMSAWQNFKDNEGLKVGVGFQIFNTYRLVGYHFKLFNNRVFIEPSISITHRPFHSEMPPSFKVLDDKWPKFFFGEPGLHFGFNF